jgi:aminomethyltransferase
MSNEQSICFNKLSCFQVMKQLNDNTAWTKKRVGIMVDGRRPPAHPSDIFKDGKKVGRVTSGTVSPVLDKGIGMAYLVRTKAV